MRLLQELRRTDPELAALMEADMARGGGSSAMMDQNDLLRSVILANQGKQGSEELDAQAEERRRQRAREAASSRSFTRTLQEIDRSISSLENAPIDVFGNPLITEANLAGGALLPDNIVSALSGMVGENLTREELQALADEVGTFNTLTAETLVQSIEGMGAGSDSFRQMIADTKPLLGKTARGNRVAVSAIAERGLTELAGILTPEDKAILEKFSEAVDSQSFPMAIDRQKSVSDLTADQQLSLEAARDIINRNPDAAPEVLRRLEAGGINTRLLNDAD